MHTRQVISVFKPVFTVYSNALQVKSIGCVPDGQMVTTLVSPTCFTAGVLG